MSAKTGASLEGNKSKLQRIQKEIKKMEREEGVEVAGCHNVSVDTVEGCRKILEGLKSLANRL